MSKNYKPLKTIGFISIAIMLSKILGMARDILFASKFGAGGISDAFNAASDLPLQFFDLTLGAAIMSTFIPVFCEKLKNDDKPYEFASTFLNVVFLISGFFVVLGIVFSKEVINVFAGGLAVDKQILASQLLAIMLPTMMLTAVAYVFAGLLQSLGEYNVPAIISVVSNLIVIGYLAFFDSVYGLAIAIVIGWLSQILVQVPSLIKRKVKFTFKVNLKDEGLKKAGKMAIPILISSWATPICVMINNRYASFLDEGSLSALKYANKIYILIVGVFSFAITNYIFPKLVTANFTEEKRLLKKAILGIIVIVAPIAVFMMFFSKPVISIIYQHGKFDIEAVALTSTALAYYSIGMIALGVNEIINKSFYARQDGKSPMIASIVGIVFNIALIMTLSSLGKINIASLALASSLSTNLIMIILIFKRVKIKENSEL